MRYLALFSLVLGVSVSARADIPPSFDPEECQEIWWQERQAQRTLFDSPEHAALRDLAAYQTWFATTRELDLIFLAPGSTVPPRMGVLLKRLEEVKARMYEDPAVQAVMRHPACAQVTNLAAAAHQANCFNARPKNFWEDESACLATPAVFTPPPALRPVRPAAYPAL